MIKGKLTLGYCRSQWTDFKCLICSRTEEIYTFHWVHVNIFLCLSNTQLLHIWIYVRFFPKTEAYSFTVLCIWRLLVNRKCFLCCNKIIKKWNHSFPWKPDYVSTKFTKSSNWHQETITGLYFGQNTSSRDVHKIPPHRPPPTNMTG